MNMMLLRGLPFGVRLNARLERFHINGIMDLARATSAAFGPRGVGLCLNAHLSL
jgi:hypothetical protein